MMRKFNKKKAAKRGAILVTVVFVLAFATIFIAAAMMLTQATRKRVYTEAENNQARLTVTSVAESWLHALQKCEISDSAILALCKAGAGGTGTPVRVKASATSNTIPGLETENTSSTTSFTEVTFTRSPNKTGASKDEEYTYIADFSTHIDGQVENVRAYLTYTPPTSTGGGKPFSTQIDLNAEFGQNNLEIVGDGKAQGDLDNIFLIRKGGKNVDSSFSSHSTLVYCDGDVAFKAEDIYSPDIVFLSGARLAKKTDSTMYNSKNGGGVNLFFFGDSNESIAVGTDKGNFNPSGKTFYLCKRSDNKNWTESDTKKNVVYINADGSRADGGNDLGSTFKTKVQKYASYNASYKKNGKDNYPTTDEFLGSASKLGLKRTAPSTATETSLATFLRDNCYQKKKGYVPAGTYRFTSDGFNYSQSPENNNGDHGYGPTIPFVMVLKGGSTYRFYFQGGKTFGLCHVIFIVDKPDKDAPVVFILEDEAKVYWPGTPSGTTSNGIVGGNGILAVEGRNKTGAEAAYNFVIDDVIGKNYSGATAFENTASKGYSYRYDGKNEPCAMIVGMGKNTLGLDKNIIMEAFIGMFNDDYSKGIQSTVGFRNGDNGVFYGRLMTDGLGFSGDSGSIVNPASPGSSTMGGKKPDIEKVVTCFSLKSMIYYYNLGNNKTGG